MASTCSYCNEPISAGAQICPHCRSDFLPSWNRFRRREYERDPRSMFYTGGSTDSDSIGIMEPLIVIFFLWLYWQAAVWIWHTEPVQWVVNTVLSIWNWF